MSVFASFASCSFHLLLILVTWFPSSSLILYDSFQAGRVKASTCYVWDMKPPKLIFWNWVLYCTLGKCAVHYSTYPLHLAMQSFNKRVHKIPKQSQRPYNKACLCGISSLVFFVFPFKILKYCIVQASLKTSLFIEAFMNLIPWTAARFVFCSCGLHLRLCSEVVPACFINQFYSISWYFWWHKMHDGIKHCGQRLNTFIYYPLLLTCTPQQGNFRIMAGNHSSHKIRFSPEA